MKNDPDILRVRLAKADAIRDLTAVRYTFAIDWGTFDHDDIVVTNVSPFPLTNVTLDAKVTSSGYEPWASRLSADAIKPGESRRWSTWIKARVATRRARPSCTAIRPGDATPRRRRRMVRGHEQTWELPLQQGFKRERVDARRHRAAPSTFDARPHRDQP